MTESICPELVASNEWDREILCKKGVPGTFRLFRAVSDFYGLLRNNS